VATIIAEDYAVLSVLESHAVCLIYICLPNASVSLNAVGVQARMMGVTAKELDALIKRVSHLLRLLPPRPFVPGREL